MIVERFVLGMVKNLNLSVDFALGEGLNDTFETNGREEKLKFPPPLLRASACKNLGLIKKLFHAEGRWCHTWRRGEENTFLALSWLRILAGITMLLTG